MISSILLYTVEMYQVFDCHFNINFEPFNAVGFETVLCVQIFGVDVL